MTSNDDRWRHFKSRFLDLPGIGFSLDTSGMRCAEGFEESMEPAMQRAFAAMAALEKGAVANPDENRQVGHYWLRNAEIAPTPEIRHAILETRARIAAFARAVHTGAIRPEKGARFENVLMVGIGGSALGPQLAAAALGSANDAMTPYFIDNTDPDGIDGVLDAVRRSHGGLTATLTVVLSKSGGTKETRNGMLEVAHAYRAAGLDPARHFVAVTGEGSELDRLASKEGWTARFPMWDWVGGRTSLASAVGLVGMSLQGIDVDGFLEGAKVMDDATRVPTTRVNPAARLALAWHAATGGAGKKDMVILPYKDRLALFSKYLQQLVMESLGKEKDLTGRVVEQGIAVYGNKGSTDQHAYVQQLRDGVHNFFVTFVEVLRDREGASMEVEPGITTGDYLSAFLQGTRSALHEKGRETLTITLPDVSARSLGALIALYERAVGLYASLVGINAYHQPGVEAGKKAAAFVLDVQARALAAVRAAGGRALAVEEVARAAGLEDARETVLHVLRHAAANPGRGVKSEGTGLDARFRAT